MKNVKENLNSNPDIINRMNRQNKIFIGTLGGATAGMVVARLLVTPNVFPTVFSTNMAILSGLLVGGFFGYYIGKNA